MKIKNKSKSKIKNYLLKNLKEYYLKNKIFNKLKINNNIKMFF